MNILDRSFNYLLEINRALPKPEWKSQHDVYVENDALKILDFSTCYGDTPTIIIPPQAGGHSNIADYDPPTASLIQTCLKNNRTHLYCIEYKPASISNNQIIIDDLIENMRNAIELIGNKVRIIALCQGVWQSVIYNALYPDTVEDMILCAGPIDFAVDPSNKIYKAAQKTPEYWYELVLFLNGGIWPGDLQNLGFKMMDPMKKIYQFYESLFWNLDDKDWLGRHRKFVNWFDNRQNIGAWSVDATKRLFRDNQLIKGELVINDKIVDLNEILSPITYMWADKDDITSPRQIINVEKYVVNSEIKEIRIENCGHIGAFISEKSLNNYWPLALQD